MTRINYSKCERGVIMDFDLQYQPKEIIKFFNKTHEGYDSVFAQRLNRTDLYLKHRY